MKAIYFQVNHICHSAPAVAAGYSSPIPGVKKKTTLLASALIFPEHCCLAMFVCACERKREKESEVVLATQQSFLSLPRGFLTPPSRPHQVLLLTDRTIWRC